MLLNALISKVKKKLQIVRNKDTVLNEFQKKKNNNI